MYYLVLLSTQPLPKVCLNFLTALHEDKALRTIFTSQHCLLTLSADYYLPHQSYPQPYLPALPPIYPAGWSGLRAPHADS